MQQRQENFDSLPADLQNALCFIAIYTTPMAKNRLQECCGYLNAIPIVQDGKKTFDGVEVSDDSWDDQKIDNVIEQLEQQGWIDVTYIRSSKCKSDLREQIVHHLHTTGQYHRFANVLFPVSGGRYFTKYYYEMKPWDNSLSLEDYIRELRHILITNEAVSLPEALNHLNSRDPSRNFFTETWKFCTAAQDGINWLQEAKIECKSCLLQYRLLRSLTQLEINFDTDWNLLVEIGSDPKCDPVTQVMILDYALCAGKLDEPELKRFPGTTAPSLLNAHRALIRGHYTDAVKQYRLTLKSLSHLKTSKLAVLPFLFCIFHALAELKAGNILAVQKTARIARVRDDRVGHDIKIAFYMDLGKCWSLLETIAQRLLGKSLGQVRHYGRWADDKRPDWLSTLLSFYERKWFKVDLVPVTESFLKQTLQNAENSFPWIAAELVEMCETLGVQNIVTNSIKQSTLAFRKRTKTVSLGNLFTAKKDWELRYEALEAVANKVTKRRKATSKKEPPVSRLIWQFDNGQNSAFGLPEIIPCVQKWIAKSNSWSKPKEVALI